jgi:hypothetical protein
MNKTLKIFVKFIFISLLVTNNSFSQEFINDIELKEILSKCENVYEVSKIENALLAHMKFVETVIKNNSISLKSRHQSVAIFTKSSQFKNLNTIRIFSIGSKLPINKKNDEVYKLLLTRNQQLKLGSWSINEIPGEIILEFGLYIEISSINFNSMNIILELISKEADYIEETISNSDIF